MTYAIGNPGPGLGQAQKCDWVKPVNGISTLLKVSFCHVIKTQKIFLQYEGNL